MKRPVLPALVFGLAAFLLVLLLDGAPAPAYADNDSIAEPTADDYVAEDPITVGQHEPKCDEPRPALEGRAPKRNPDHHMTDADLRELAKKYVADSGLLIHKIPDGPRLGTLRVDGKFPELTPEERARIERILRALVDRLRELAGTPNDHGQVWTERQRKVWGVATAVFLDSRVPGTHETYREAAKRMIAEAIDDAVYGLDEEKARTWRRAADLIVKYADPLVVGKRLLNDERREMERLYEQGGGVRLDVRTPDAKAAELLALKTKLEGRKRGRRGLLADLTRARGRIAR